MNIDSVFLSLVYSSTNKGRTGSLIHQSHMACIRPSYCYARQKIALSVSAGSFIALISQNNSAGSRKKLTSLTFSDTFLTPCFLTRGKLLSLVPSLPQLLLSVTPIFARVIFSNPKINSVHISYKYERCKMFVLFDLY